MVHWPTFVLLVMLYAFAASLTLEALDWPLWTAAIVGFLGWPLIHFVSLRRC